MFRLDGPVRSGPPAERDTMPPNDQSVAAPEHQDTRVWYGSAFFLRLYSSTRSEWTNNPEGEASWTPFLAVTPHLDAHSIILSGLRPCPLFLGRSWHNFICHSVSSATTHSAVQSHRWLHNQSSLPPSVHNMIRSLGDESLLENAVQRGRRVARLKKTAARATMDKPRLRCKGCLRRR